MREDLIQSAIAFLKDPQVAGSPLTKKIEFIESKGLTQEEVQEVLRRSNETPASSIPRTLSAPVAAPVTAPVEYYNAPPIVPERDWKDYFIMATTSVGVAYGLYQVVKRYVVPNIIPPSKSDIEQDKQSIDEEFLRIDVVLKEISDQNAKTTQQSAEKLEEVGQLSSKISEFLGSTSNLASQSKEDVKMLKLELENLKREVTSGLSVQNNRVDSELSSIQLELASLKQLILSRSKTQETPSTESPAPSILTRKVPPISSIPSAKDILAKEQLKKQVTPPVEPEAQEVAKTEVKEEVKVEVKADTGIPAWQQAANKKTPGDDGIPAWQKASNA
ncbi:hypothetical protein BABINDRAFT_160903 [Babjeviella inositovora NRRL Y-12698]|uniref:Peroxisomal membrane protein PEX14 n=1 Tax=Babjeviella inositovora NRRL Y-12698 TaxID=984486 RepID=A0A1E3QUN8_9ASCO|nr:uncharacterized protein BABINDRAFT_160903 [Babjeviella inositovora NRRL Y-12698]ODQ80657.1 hypothetical protein BABINDRAFT_160903 [Babjeviella inositovora NRRL Y-12698]